MWGWASLPALGTLPQQLGHHPQTLVLSSVSPETHRKYETIRAPALPLPASVRLRQMTSPNPSTTFVTQSSHLCSLTLILVVPSDRAAGKWVDTEFLQMCKLQPSETESQPKPIIPTEGSKPKVSKPEQIIRESPRGPGCP